MMPISRGVRASLAIVVAATLGSATLQAQSPFPMSPAQGPALPPVDGASPGVQRDTNSTPLTSLRLVVAIQRYEGEKRISSHPYTLWVNANDGQTTRLTAGQQVPIPTSVISSASGTAVPMRSVNYQNIGTNISARATQAADGRFRVSLDVEDSSIVPAEGPDGYPTLKSLKTTNLLLLSDGQHAEFLAATDKLSGEVTRIAVTVSVLK
jgi:hypothetical protein